MSVAFEEMTHQGFFVHGQHRLAGNTGHRAPNAPAWRIERNCNVTPTPVIGLCMIVKNEAHVIERCLRNVRPLHRPRSN